MGRPLKDIDQAKVEEMAYDGASNRQIADILGYADGAIVGSALVRALAEDGVDGVARLAAQLATGTGR